MSIHQEQLYLRNNLGAYACPVKSKLGTGAGGVTGGLVNFSGEVDDSLGCGAAER